MTEPPKPIEEMTDKELVELFDNTDPDDPLIDRLANEMEARGCDY